MKITSKKYYTSQFNTSAFFSEKEKKMGSSFEAALLFSRTRSERHDSCNLFHKITERQMVCCFARSSEKHWRYTFLLGCFRCPHCKESNENYSCWQDKEIILIERSLHPKIMKKKAFQVFGNFWKVPQLGSLMTILTLLNLSLQLKLRPSEHLEGSWRHLWLKLPTLR